MHTQGKLECNQSCSNSIDLLSTETGDIVAQLISEDDELGAIEIENASRLELCWNSHDALLEACEELQSSAGELSGSLDDGLAEHEWGNTNRVDKAIIKAKAAIEQATT